MMGLLALGVMVFLIVSNWRIYNDSQVVNAEIQKTAEQLQLVKDRQETLQAALSATQGADFQEELMRDQGYKKPGEQVIAILQDPQQDAKKKDSKSQDKPQSFWQMLLGNFIK